MVTIPELSTSARAVVVLKRATARSLETTRASRDRVASQGM
jgi:hypothetical protein